MGGSKTTKVMFLAPSDPMEERREEKGCGGITPAVERRGSVGPPIVASATAPRAGQRGGGGEGERRRTGAFQAARSEGRVVAPPRTGRRRSRRLLLRAEQGRRWLRAGAASAGSGAGDLRLGARALTPCP
jgi:hypothetical protein